MSKRYLGVDVHSKTTSYCVVDESGVVVGEGEVETRAGAFQDLVGKHGVEPGTTVALETGTQARWCALVFEACGLKPVVVDASEVRQKARRRGQKCDRRDAFEIADGLRRDQWQRIVWMPGEEVVALRRALSRRRHFVRLTVSQINAAKYQLRALGHRTSEVRLSSMKGWEELLRREDIEEEVREDIGLHHETWLHARRIVARLEKRIEALLEPFKETMELLTTVPGVGQVVAATFIATIGDPERFASAGEVASYLGLTPSTYDSGGRERHGRITRQGSPSARAVLCEAAQHARKPSHPLNPYFRRLAARSGHKRAIVAVAHRLARILWQMWRRRERFDVRKLNVERTNRKQSKTIHWELKQSA